MSSPRKWALRVEHILDAIAKIERYVDDLDEESFSANSLVVDAVIRNFQVLGEAARHVPEDIQKRFPEIPWSLMMGTRHVIVHGYDVVRLDIIWRTIKDDLPPLVAPLTAVLDTARAEEDAADESQ
jgi:uncharacterized protein with HEPN domain